MRDDNPNLRTRVRSVSSSGPLPTIRSGHGILAARGGLQQLQHALLPAQATDIQHMVAAADVGPRAERLVDAEAQRHRGQPAEVGHRVDVGHHRIHVTARAPQPAAQQRRVDARRAGQRRGLEVARAVVHGDGAGADLARAGDDVDRPPERVVEQDDVGAQRAQRLLQRTGAERDAVAVGGDDAQRRQLVAAVLVALLGTGDEHVVLDLPRADRVLGLGIEVGPDAAGALAVEERDVGDPQRRRRARRAAVRAWPRRPRGAPAQAARRASAAVRPVSETAPVDAVSPLASAAPSPRARR